MPADSPVPALHVVTDDAVLAREGFLEDARRILSAGGDRVALHVRGPDTGGGRLLRLATGLSSEAAALGAWLMVNDRVDVALAAHARGVHLGRRSPGPSTARKLLGPGAVVGISTHATAEVAEAAEGGADYAFVGTIFPTPSHPGREGRGAGALEEAAAVSGGLPLIAIGGVDVDRVKALLAAGAHGVAVIRGVWEADAPEAAVERYLEALETG